MSSASTHANPTAASREPRAWLRRRSWVPRIALVGCDGVGKSTAIEAARKHFASHFPEAKFVVRQWRPDVLPPLIRLTGRSNPTPEIHKPRRKAGPFPLVRLFYYGIDFLVGGWWKDRARKPGEKVVIYDRCALDMQVDPLRFGLPNARGTRLLRQLTPRPDLVLFIEDTPERIWERKRELEMHEMREHMQTWRELAREGVVTAVLRAEGAAETGERVADLVHQTYVEHAVSEQRVPASLESCIQVLAAQSETIRVRIARSDTKTSPWWHRHRQYAILPSLNDPRILAPLDSPQAAVAALDVYNPQRPLARIWKRAAELAFRTGLARWVFRDTVSIETLRADARLPESLFSDYLESLLGQPVTLGMTPGTPGAHAKPVTRVADRDGCALAFVKTGWNHATATLVGNEIAVLKRLADVHFSTARVPAVKHAGEWRGFSMLVMDAVEARRSSAQITDAHLQFLAELHEATLDRQPLEWKAWSESIDGMLGHLQNAGHHYFAHLMRRALHVANNRISQCTIPSSMRHGDFAPWNIREADGRLLVIDWESASEASLPAWDLFHFLVQTANLIEGKRPVEIFEQVFQPGSTRTLIERFFHTIRVDQLLIEPLFVAYLVEVLCQSLVREGLHCEFQERNCWAALLTQAVLEME